MILRILLEAFLVRHTRRPVGIRKHDEPVYLLDAPSTLRELHGQPIKQFRMSRCFSLTAEIIGCSDDSLVEVTQPDPVHHNAAQERLVRGGQPQCESLPALRNKENTTGLVDGRTRV